MKKLYHSKTCLNKHHIKLMLFTCLLVFNFYTSLGQVRVPFGPRASQSSPSVTTYNIKGDFSMMGNTNLTLLNYSDTAPNTNNMVYVDVDGDSNTFNSSSATLNFSTENGAIPECSNILFAGIYWFGKADTGNDLNIDGDNDPNTFNVTKNGITKSLDKRKVLIDGPGSNGYEEINASVINTGPELYFPSGIDINLYSAFADVTEYVRVNGIGEYFIADIALTEGSQSPDGLSGGWGMLVIYENSEMNWRDITVFDGHAFVSGNNGTETFSFNVNGFTAAQQGPVNVKLGVMAGEGEPNFRSDFVEIEVQNTGTYQRLENTTTTETDNFFTSTIETGGNARTPNLVNNTGVDILTLDIPNTGNNIIRNGQTATSFRYGSGSDGFAIFNLTFAVDAYVPEPEVIISNTSINGTTPGPTNNDLEPGENAGFEIAIRNTGTEAINNAILTIPIPPSIDPNNIIINSSVNPPLSTTNVPVYDSNSGAIVWDLETLPTPTDPNTILAELGFTITVTTDCSILNANNFDPTVPIGGTLSGTGAISNESFTTDLIQGYESTGLCTGNPIPTPIIIGIDYIDYISEDPVITAPSTIDVEGCDENDITTLLARYPYSASESSDIKDTYVTTGYTVSDNGTIVSITYIDQVVANSSCPLEVLRTFTATDNCGNTGTAQLTIRVNDTVDPSISGDIVSTTIEGCTIADVTAPVDNVAALEALGLNISDNCTDDNNLTVTSTDNNSGSCPIVITRTYTITDACDNSATYQQTIEIDDNTQPTITCPGDITVNIDTGLATANVTVALPTVSDNCSGVVTFENDFNNTQNASGVYNLGTTVVTYTATDSCGNTTQCSFEVTVNDDEAPQIDCPPAIEVTCIDLVPDAYANYNEFVNAGGTASDNNGIDEASFTLVSQTSDNNTCPETITRTYRISDIDGNDSQCTQQIIVNDTVNPSISGDIAGTTIEGCTIADVTAPVDNVAALEALGLNISDNCTDDTNLTVTSADNNSGSCPIVITRTYTITDACDNSATYQQTIEIDDNTQPTITCPVDITVNVDTGLSTANVTVALPTVSDNCSGAVTFENNFNNTQNASGTYNLGTTVVTYTATDSCGNTTQCSFEVTVNDDEAPQIDCPPAIEVTCIDLVPDAYTNYNEFINAGGTASDNNGIDEASFTLVSQTSDNNTCPETITRTYRISDIDGNDSQCTQQIIVNDTVNPSISGDIAGTTIEGCTIADVTAPVDNVAALEALGLNISDNCTDDTNLTVTSADNNSGSCPIVITRTYTITDACDNSATYQQTINIAPANITFTAPQGDTSSAAEFDDPDSNVAQANLDNDFATWLDNQNTTINNSVAGGCSPVVTNDYNNQTLDFCSSGSIIVNWSITDLCQTINNISATYSYTQPDNINFTDPSNKEVDTCTFDNDDINVAQNNLDTDIANWVDEQTNIINNTITGGSPSVSHNFTNQSIDICDGGNIVITWTIDDICENIERQATYILNPPADVTFTAPQGDTSNAAEFDDPDSNVAQANLDTDFATWLDNQNTIINNSVAGGCSPVVTNDYNNQTLDFCSSGSIIVNWTITDLCQTINNISATYSYTQPNGINFTDPSGKEVDTCTFDNDDVNIAQNNLDTDIANWVDEQTNIINNTITGGSPSVSHNFTNQSIDLCEGGNIVITWTIDDICENIERQATYILNPPADVTFTAPEDYNTLSCEYIDQEAVNLAFSNWITEQTNNFNIANGCSPIITNNSTSLSPPVLCDGGSTTVEWDISDICFSTKVYASFNLAGTSNINYDLPSGKNTDACGFTATNLETAQNDLNTDLVEWVTDQTDLITSSIEGGCQPVITNNYSNQIIDFCESGEITVTWSVNDTCTTIDNITATYKFTAATVPEFNLNSLPQDSQVECDAIPEVEEIKASNSCGEIEVNFTETRTDGNCSGNFSLERLWTAIDVCGRVISHRQTITVSDTKAPVPTTDFETELDVSCTDIPEVPELIFEDNCSTDIFKSFKETSTYQEDVYEDYQIVRTWVVADDCDNQATYTQTLNVALDEFVLEPVFSNSAPTAWCFDEGPLNLDNYLPDDLNRNGTWEMIEGDVTATLTNNIFDPSNLELSFDFLPGDGGINYRFRYTTNNANSDYSGESVVGCINVVDLNINVHADCVVLPCGQKDVIISKLITPNGDSHNESFEIGGIELCGFTYAIKIFNRWGALVYESDDYQNDWNATSSSASFGSAGRLPNGTYYYIINIKDSGLEPFTGPVYIGTK